MGDEEEQDGLPCLGVWVAGIGEGEPVEGNKAVVEPIEGEEDDEEEGHGGVDEEGVEGSVARGRWVGEHGELNRDPVGREETLEAILSAPECGQTHKLRTFNRTIISDTLKNFKVCNNHPTKSSQLQLIFDSEPSAWLVETKRFDHSPMRRPKRLGASWRWRTEVLHR